VVYSLVPDEFVKVVWGAAAAAVTLLAARAVAGRGTDVDAARS
jgi:hypothetical protein